MRIPRFALLVAGIVIAGAGGCAFSLGVDWRIAGALAAFGIALGVIEFAPIERGRAAAAAQLERDRALLAPGAADNPEIDDDWLHRNFGGPPS